MKLNRFFSVILCASLLSANIGFASEGSSGHIPSAVDVREAARRAYNAMPDVRGRMSDVGGDVRGYVSNVGGAAKRAYNAASSVGGKLYNAMPDVRGRLSDLYNAAPDVRGRASNMWEGSTPQKMWQNIPSTDWFTKFVANNYGKLLTTMIGLYGLNKLYADIQGYLATEEGQRAQAAGWGTVGQRYGTTAAVRGARAVSEYGRSARRKASEYLPGRLGGKSALAGEEAETPLSFDGYQQLKSSQQMQYLGTMSPEKAGEYEGLYKNWLEQQVQK